MQFYNMAAEVVNWAVVHQSTLVLNSAEVLRIPPHRKAADRYRQL
jgi:hypothetical protein